MKSHNYYVYILLCNDDSYYVGVTNNLKRRLREHTYGRSKTAYTFSRRPVVLKYCRHFRYILDAIAWEKQLKGWSRKKKEALFQGDWEKIMELAKPHQKWDVYKKNRKNKRKGS